MFIRSPEELSAILTNQRKKQKLSQEEVAERVGLLQKTISKSENNPEGMQVETLFRILSALNLNVYIIPKNQANEQSVQWKEEW